MDVLNESCAGLDVHKKMVMACVRHLHGRRQHKETRQFGTMTADLLELADWLESHGVTHVAMESTGVFWKPIYNLLEGRFELLLCNARHIKQVPGRKTDMSDAEWISQLLQCGLLKGSFIPPRQIRDLRDMTRHRAQLVDEKTRVANRIQKVLEDANIKLASVASDVLGASGRHMLQSIIDGQLDPSCLAQLARRRLRSKIPQLKLALQGGVTEHHRFMLKTLFTHLEFLEEQIEAMGERIEESMRREDELLSEKVPPPIPFAEALRLLDEIPGINARSAQNVLAEIGRTMSQFPSAKHLSSWTGICPGNNETGGHRKNQKTTSGNRWLRRALTQCAWAAAHTKNTYFSSLYRRLAARRGKKRAIIAVAHALLQVIYHVLDRRLMYEDLGSDYFDHVDAQRKARYHVKRLESLGYAVTIQSPAA